jgi:SAM-dependent methyltransferase
MASLFPYRGKILDGGSGHGLFSLALALQSSHRKVSGIDHSRLRVKIAQEAGAGLPGLRFTEGNYAGLPGGPWDGIALVDVLHYLPRSQQAKLFHRAFRSLRPGGLFLFREVDRSPGALSFLNRLHEKLMTGLGFTKAEGLYLRSREEWMDLASEAGFQLRSHPVGRFPFADVLFLGRKP